MYIYSLREFIYIAFVSLFFFSSVITRVQRDKYKHLVRLKELYNY